MKKKANNNGSFDPAVFLATAKNGRTISDHAKGDVIFSQGDPADAVFYIKKGNVQIAVTSEHGKEAILARPP
jgi:CRP-like cAMP-binding protein